MNAEQILLTVLVGLSSWTLHSVVRLREQVARYEALAATLPCKPCPCPIPAVRVASAAVLAFVSLLFAGCAVPSVTETSTNFFGGFLLSFSLLAIAGLVGKCWP